MYRRNYLTISIIIFLILSGSSVRGAEIGNIAKDWEPSPTNAALRSMVLPGWGEAYAGQPVKAVIVGGLAGGFGYGVYKQHQLYLYFKDEGNDDMARFFRDDRNRLTWYLAGTIILSMLDAFVDAHLYNFDVSENLSLSGDMGMSGSGGIRLQLGLIIGS